MGTRRSYRQPRYEFGKQLLALRTRAALTQLELAQQVGVHRRSVQNWEIGESYPKTEVLQRLIALLLRQAGFTPGYERAEAHTLWQQAAADSTQFLADFDEAWFAQQLAAYAAAAMTPSARVGAVQPFTLPPALINTEPVPTIMDWGEAIAPPSLYGREDEMTTLAQWTVDNHYRVVAILGLGGVGKTSLAITFAHRVIDHFDLVLFRSLQKAPLLADVLDPIIHLLSTPAALPPEQLPDKIALLVQLFRKRRCLLILDNLETIMQPGTLTGTYRTGYADYGELLRGLSERAHQSCLLLTSREKPVELGPLEGQHTAVRVLALGGLNDHACQRILAAKDIVGTATDMTAMARLYGGNPLALNLVSEQIGDLFGGDLGAFLAAGSPFFGGVNKLLEQHFVRLTLVEQSILYWLAIEREQVLFSDLVANVGELVSPRELLHTLEALRRRMLIERSSGQTAFTLAPVILAYVTEKLVEAVAQEIINGQPNLLNRHLLVKATAQDDLRHTQVRLIALPLLKRLVATFGDMAAVEQRLLTLLDIYRSQPLREQMYAPSNMIHLLCFLRGHLRGLNLANLAIRQVDLQEVEAQDSRFVRTVLAQMARP